jgi:hypothetical protein
MCSFSVLDAVYQVWLGRPTLRTLQLQNELREGEVVKVPDRHLTPEALLNSRFVLPWNTQVGLEVLQDVIDNGAAPRRAAQLVETRDRAAGFVAEREQT